MENCGHWFCCIVLLMWSIGIVWRGIEEKCNNRDNVYLRLWLNPEALLCALHNTSVYSQGSSLIYKVTLIAGTMKPWGNSFLYLLFQFSISYSLHHDQLVLVYHYLFPRLYLWRGIKLSSGQSCKVAEGGFRIEGGEGGDQDQETKQFILGITRLTAAGSWEDCSSSSCLPPG